ncbi:hypothetical protein ACHAXS_011506 [Conticribra weissflogii]
MPPISSHKRKPTDPLSALGANDPSLLAFACRGDGVDDSEQTMLRLVVASSRIPFRATDGTFLNVECFGPKYHQQDQQKTENGTSSSQFFGGSEISSAGNECANDDDHDDGSKKSNIRRSYHHGRSMQNVDEWPILLYVHGVCESAETWGVQTLAQNCAKHCWRLVVLELAGHGLSSDVGGGSFSRRATCPNFESLVQHVVEFTIHAKNKFHRSQGIALCGVSLGGALIAYSVKDILSIYSRNGANTSKDPKQKEGEKQQHHPKFYGIVLLAPSFGVHPQALPPSPVIAVLKTLSCLLPSHGILTPIEHSEEYSCPPSSARNFSGRWPLSTANMLLDVTSNTIPIDVLSNRVNGLMAGLASLLVMIGDRDEVVPFDSVQRWFDAATNLREDTGEKKLIKIKNGRHGFIHDRGSVVFVDRLFQWLNTHAGQVKLG